MFNFGKKYTFAKDEKITFDGRVLYRVQALKDFGKYRKGAIGGYIEHEHNLSQEGDCWVDDDACVYGGAQVLQNAVVLENAVICGQAIIYGNAVISGNAKVCDNAKVCGNSRVYENALVCGNADLNNHLLYGSTMISGTIINSVARMDEKYTLTDKSITVRGHTLYRVKALKNFGNVKKGDLGGFVESRENLSTAGTCWVANNATVYGNAKVYGNAMVYGNAEVYGGARVGGYQHIR